VASRIPAPQSFRSRPDWIDQIVAAPEKREVRRSELEGRMGAPVGRRRGLDHYVAAHGDVTVEVLVNPETALPAEMNATRGAGLVARTTFTYSAHPAGVLVRRGLHSELALAESAGARAVTDVELTNVVLSEGGAR
jgi:hypothetical protein